jgi:hypothetical protein
MQAPQGAAGHDALAHITSVLGWALQQLLDISAGGMPHQQQAQQLQQQQPLLLLDPDRFEARALEGPWTQVSPHRPADLSQLALLAQQMGPAGCARSMLAPAAAAAVLPPPAAAPAADAVQPQSGVALNGAQLSAGSDSLPEPTVDLGQDDWQQGRDELQNMPLSPASVPEQQRQQQEQDVHQPQQGQQEPPLARTAAAAGAGGPASSPVPWEPITTDSSASGSVSHGFEEGEAADTAEGPAQHGGGAAGGTTAAGPPNLRLGEPEVASGKRAACCTIVRLSLAGMWPLRVLWYLQSWCTVCVCVVCAAAMCLEQC